MGFREGRLEKREWIVSISLLRRFGMQDGRKVVYCVIILESLNETFCKFTVCLSCKKGSQSDIDFENWRSVA